jgi:limonene-1,2-epoxide hydrolase
MSTDAQYHVYAWEEPFVGREAIGAELLKQPPAFSDTEEEILNVASVGRSVFLERHDIITMFGNRAAVAVVGCSNSTPTARSRADVTTLTAERSA